jgi:YVTN family beta-propeller protein
MRALLFAFLLSLALPAGSVFAADKPAPIAVDVPLPGDTSRFDYASLDTARHLLFIAHLGASEVLAFDTQTRTVVARIANVSHVHGVLAVPQLHRVYASATGTDEVVVIDEDTLTITARMPGGHYPDGMAYAPDVHKLYVSDETGATETVIDTATNRRVATIELGGEAGNTQYDDAGKHVFVNVQTRNDLVEINPATDRIVARIALPGAAGNHGLLIDAARHRAFIACEDNDTLLVLDLAARVVQATFRVGHAPDMLAQDTILGRVYVASESGVVSVFDAKADAVTKISERLLGPNAHVVAIDSVRHLAYLPLKDAGHGPVLRLVRIEP